MSIVRYLCQGGDVFDWVCLLICLSVIILGN